MITRNQSNDLQVVVYESLKRLQQNTVPQGCVGAGILDTTHTWVMDQIVEAIRNLEVPRDGRT